MNLLRNENWVDHQFDIFTDGTNRTNKIEFVSFVEKKIIIKASIEVRLMSDVFFFFISIWRILYIHHVRFGEI